MNDEIKALHAALGRGETLQYWVGEHGVRVPWKPGIGVEVGDPKFSWGVKPRTRTVTIELPEAVREPLKDGDDCWVIELSGVQRIRYSGGILADHKWLAQGRVFRTESEANAARDALLKALRGE